MQDLAKTVDAAAIQELQTFVNQTERSDAQILRKIEALPVSADAKALLSDMLRLATRVGQTMLRIGRKILDFALSLLQQFPHLGFATLIALVLGVLLGFVPVLGTLLGAAITPLLLALGVAVGAQAELEQGDLAERVRAFAGQFRGLAA
ncbi:hypothetical protein [Inhella sp.]|uniref:hypothetical protein n=1 Tax=Inhella sp. TaxID=1921806 RepID=UPI0035AF2663